MKAYKQLLENFLAKAKDQGFSIEAVAALRTNTYQVGKANILVRTASDLGKRYFFGLNYINAEEIYNLDHSFVIFVCGEADNAVFMPTDVLVKHLPQISHDRNGEYKINFTRDLHLVLRGKNNRLNCSEFINNWGLVKNIKDIIEKRKALSRAEESIHNVIQGRLIEIGNIRGFDTYSPDKSKTFNKISLGNYTSLKECPKLQFTEYSLLRRIDVVWFRKVNAGYYPTYAFEVEISTGIWSGFGRLATLRDHDAKPYIVTNDGKKFQQVINQFPEIKNKYINIIPDQVGLLYAAEKNLITMRKEFNL